MEEQITISRIGSKITDTGIQLGTDGVNELLNIYKEASDTWNYLKNNTAFHTIPEDYKKIKGISAEIQEAYQKMDSMINVFDKDEKMSKTISRYNEYYNPEELNNMYNEWRSSPDRSIVIKTYAVDEKGVVGQLEYKNSDIGSLSDGEKIQQEMLGEYIYKTNRIENYLDDPTIKNNLKELAQDEVHGLYFSKGENNISFSFSKDAVSTVSFKYQGKEMEFGQIEKDGTVRFFTDEYRNTAGMSQDDIDNAKGYNIAKEFTEKIKRRQSMADHKSDHIGKDSQIAEQMMTKTEAKEMFGDGESPGPVYEQKMGIE